MQWSLHHPVSICYSFLRLIDCLLFLSYYWWIPLTERNRYAESTVRFDIEYHLLHYPPLRTHLQCLWNEFGQPPHRSGFLDVDGRNYGRICIDVGSSTACEIQEIQNCWAKEIAYAGTYAFWRELYPESGRFRTRFGPPFLPLNKQTNRRGEYGQE